MDIESILKQMTLEEKAALVSGTDFMYTNPIPRLGIPSLCMSDGPHGLRKQKAGGDNGITASEPATAFPTAVTTASGWNPDNLKRMGAAISRECRHYGVHTLLGHGVNIKRNPLCGRNFENVISVNMLILANDPGKCPTAKISSANFLLIAPG